MAKVTKMLISLVFLLISLFLIFKLLNPTPNNSLATKKITLGKTLYNIELAKTNLERSAGLSNRKSLCPNCGMIFIFDQPSTYPFWMKDTLIPLDIIWLDESGKIVTIHEARPEPNIPFYKLKLYQNKEPALYVLELNAGDTHKLNLKIGDKITLPQW